ncbi:MAG: hypothetical protein LBQ84_02250 [Flavobacteriaceae bacterium]|jgi:hypothetical protein|nr:hypothetical protein [Flavobacteriaceae bacterium]
MKKVYFILLITVFYALPAAAQIAVGGSKPTEGAIIDLNNNLNNERDRAKGGLLLSNVTLTSLTDIPTDQFTGMAGLNQTALSAAKIALTGAMVWNIGYTHPTNPSLDIKKGVYIWVWTGTNPTTDGWKYLGGGD